ncbi:hypothetical protein PMAYCL1PPCAC_03104, partial [Pristionchus mayeri]
ITKCLGEGAKCALDDSLRPSILPNVPQSPSSLPSLSSEEANQGVSSSSVPLSEILEQLTRGNTSRVLILEAGFESPISWMLTDCNLQTNEEGFTATSLPTNPETTSPIDQTLQKRRKREVVS